MAGVADDELVDPDGSEVLRVELDHVASGRTRWMRLRALVNLLGDIAGGVQSIVAGDGVTVDATDPANPVVSATATGGGVAVTREFSFAFDTPDLLTGVAFYTPTVGERLLDAWIEIDEAWDGTTPKGDVGTFGGDNVGFYAAASGACLNMDVADYGGSGWGDGVLVGGQESNLTLVNAIGDTIDSMRAGDTFFNSGDPNGVVTSVRNGDRCFDFTTPAIWVAAGAASTVWNALLDGQHVAESVGPFGYPNYRLDDGVRTIPLRFTAADPLKVCVSQDGTNTGADPGSTQGQARVVFTTVIPLTL